MYNLITKLASIFLKEAINFAQIARKVKNPLIILPKNNGYVIICVREENESYHVAGAIDLQPNRSKVNDGFNQSDWLYRIARVWAEDEWTSMYLFGAALAYVGKLVSDTNVSPAAQLIIKKYFTKYVNDNTKIIPEVLKEANWNKSTPWLRAGYLSDNPTAYQSAFDLGQQIANSVDPKSFLDLENKSWQFYYANVGKTKWDDPKTLRETRGLQQMGVPDDKAEEIYSAMERGEEPDLSGYEHLQAPEPDEQIEEDPSKSKDIKSLLKKVTGY